MSQEDVEDVNHEFKNDNINSNGKAGPRIQSVPNFIQKLSRLSKKADIFKEESVQKRSPLSNDSDSNA